MQTGLQGAGGGHCESSATFLGEVGFSRKLQLMGQDQHTSRSLHGICRMTC